MNQDIRINKFIAHSIGLSRRESDAAIQAGRVTINGQKAVLGAAVSPSDLVAMDGKPILAQSSYTYLMLHKPVGYLCSRKSQGGVPTIFELLPEKYRHLKPVGRLDKDSSGLILLTDDGDFAHRMTHPKFHKTKIYEVRLDSPLQPLHQQMISDYGVTLEDGASKFLIEKTGVWGLENRNWGRSQNQQNAHQRVAASGVDSLTGPASSDLRSVDEGEAYDGSGEKPYQVTLTEGRNRQIRRTFAALGYTVTYLHRTHFGKYSLSDMKKGEYKLTDIK